MTAGEQAAAAWHKARYDSALVARLQATTAATSPGAEPRPPAYFDPFADEPPADVAGDTMRELARAHERAKLRAKPGGTLRPWRPRAG